MNKLTTLYILYLKALVILGLPYCQRCMSWHKPKGNAYYDSEQGYYCDHCASRMMGEES